MLVYSKIQQLRHSLIMMQLCKDMSLGFDDLVMIDYKHKDGKFLIDDRNLFSRNEIRIVNKDNVITITKDSQNPRTDIFVMIKDVEEVMKYIIDNYKNHKFYEICLSQYASGQKITYEEYNKSFPGSYETLISDEPFDYIAYEEENRIAIENMEFIDCGPDCTTTVPHRHPKPSPNRTFNSILL
jgi:hypothetical protein